ncbi:hypothetical protein GCM10027169_29260 [Gordonia jinhuaensis]|uniref:Uncharacterized protein n=1 Tax=Gordonia jinhuaensis TaxID=1517702 RepID=A0A916T9J2_9ACTN|nr:hypothetical protein GCM10011489_24860 [Gordonia jinhuaensis]
MRVGQLSFFSAEVAEPGLGDLSGLLATNGQAASSSAGVRISIVVDADWRADALVDEIIRCGVGAQTSRSDEDSPMARTDTSQALAVVAGPWTRGAVKVVPAGWVPSARALRLWVIASGRREGPGYLLGLDPRSPDTHPALATSLMRAGVAPTLVGTRGRAALRISGRRRLTRLAETVGAPPEAADAQAVWPAE